MIGELPLVGEYSIMGFLLLVISWFIYAIITGKLVNRKILEDQKENTTFFKDALATEREITERLLHTVKDLEVVGENMEKILNALPHGGDES